MWTTHVPGVLGDLTQSLLGQEHLPALATNYFPAKTS